MITCDICGGTDTIEIENRPVVPVAQNLRFVSKEAAISCRTGSLELRRCLGCGFVWNLRFDPRRLDYDPSYDNDQGFSSRFAAHSNHVAETVVQRLATMDHVHLVEIGCGQGKFIAKLAEALGERLESAIGFDPALQGEGRGLSSRCELRREYFTAESLRSDDPPPGAVISRHVIEHVPDIRSFLTAIRGAVEEGTPLFLETPDVEWILSRGVFFDFYYEHCSLFTADALTLALRQSGFEIEEIHPVFDDQYMLATAVACRPGRRTMLPGPFDDRSYRRKRDRFLLLLAALVDESCREGPTALWGGASKGVTICLSLPDAEERLDCVIDINERKHGTFLPGSGLPVVSPDEALRRGVRTVIVVNPAYDDEVERICREQGLGFRVVSIAALELGLGE
jgi:hypothetical protein